MINLAHAAGKYGSYVWPAYGVSLAGLIAMIADTLARTRRWRRRFDRERDDLSPKERGES